jgi:hypothetical protein
MSKKRISKDNKERIQGLLLQVKSLCENQLENIFTLGNDIKIDSIVNYTYSPNADLVYVYINDNFSGHLLFRELKSLLTKKNGVDMKSIEKDVVNDMFIIELEFGNKKIIKENLQQEVAVRSIDDRHL